MGAKLWQWADIGGKGFESFTMLCHALTLFANLAADTKYLNWLKLIGLRQPLIANPIAHSRLISQNFIHLIQKTFTKSSFSKKTFTTSRLLCGFPDSHDLNATSVLPCRMAGFEVLTNLGQFELTIITVEQVKTLKRNQLPIGSSKVDTGFF